MEEGYKKKNGKSNEKKLQEVEERRKEEERTRQELDALKTQQKKQPRSYQYYLRVCGMLPEKGKISLAYSHQRGKKAPKLSGILSDCLTSLAAFTS